MTIVMYGNKKKSYQLIKSYKVLIVLYEYIAAGVLTYQLLTLVMMLYVSLLKLRNSSKFKIICLQSS